MGGHPLQHLQGHHTEEKARCWQHHTAWQGNCCPPNKTCRVQDWLGPSFLQSNYASLSHASCNIKFVAGILSAHVLAGLNRSTAISKSGVPKRPRIGLKIVWLQIQSHILMLPRVWHLKKFPDKKFPFSLR